MKIPDYDSVVVVGRVSHHDGYIFNQYDVSQVGNVFSTVWYVRWVSLMTLQYFRTLVELGDKKCLKL